MNKKLIGIAVIYIVLIVIMSLFIINRERTAKQENETVMKNIGVTANEIKQSIASGNLEAAELATDKLASDYLTEGEENVVHYSSFLALIVSIAGILTMLIYIDISILRPFRELKDYAHAVSVGDMDKPLEMKRENYFGDFTWAFDNMRREIIKSRRAEKEAIENNKTVIATLSHDIKTPVSSIRAYAEAFEANMDSGAEKRQKYLSVIMEKCDEVTRLTNDLFIHSISEMSRLDIRLEKVELAGFIRNEVGKLFVDEDIDMILPEEEAIYAEIDPKRLLQIFENLKNNSEKYAKTGIQIQLERCEDNTSDNKNSIRIHFRDYGPGIPEDEIPFITGKFYRGKNAGTENGSGLGLYIVKELMDKMGGKVMLLNKDPGLEVVLEFS